MREHEGGAVPYAVARSGTFPPATAARCCVLTPAAPRAAEKLKDEESQAAALEAMGMQAAAMTGLGQDMSFAAEDMQHSGSNAASMMRSMLSMGTALYSAFGKQLQAEGRTEVAAAKLADFFGGSPPTDKEEL